TCAAACCGATCAAASFGSSYRSRRSSCWGWWSAPLPEALHVVMTLECDAVARRGSAGGPRNWELSARAIDGFCTRLLRRGFSPTVFVAPQAAAAHAPLFEELASCGVDVGLLIGGEGHYLGNCTRDEQRAMLEAHVRAFQDALGMRPQSARGA